MRPVLAEALGTFWIVLVVAGLLAEGYVGPGLGAGAAAGLAYLAVALSLGQITTGHFNPALTLGLRIAGGFGGSLTFTLLAQIGGATAAMLLVGPPAAAPESLRPFPAMLMLLPLVAVPVLVHITGLRMRAEAVAYANAVTLVCAVALAPGGHAGVSAAHATAAWLTGDGAPIGLWRIWLVTLAGVGLAGWLWGHLAAPSPVRGSTGASEPVDDEEDDFDDADDAREVATRDAAPALMSVASPQSQAGSEPNDGAEAARLAARALTAEALVAAGWTPPGTQDGRIRKNTPVRKTSR